MMLSRIISGGRSGAEIAALAAALAMGIHCQGWLSPGSDPGAGADPYGLKALPENDPRNPDEVNALEADGTLIITYGEITGLAAAVRDAADRRERPWLHIDLVQRSKFDAAMAIRAWIVEKRIAALHVSGATSNESPAIRAATTDLIESVTYLLQMESGPDRNPGPLPVEPQAAPRTVPEAVTRLAGAMSLKDRTLIANLSAAEIPSLFPTLGDYILHRFELAQGNAELLVSCRFFAGSDTLTPPAAMEVILKALWDELRHTHRLRLVK